MTKFSGEKKTVIENTGLIFFTWAVLFVLFWDFKGYDIDLYDALIASLTF